MESKVLRGISGDTRKEMWEITAVIIVAVCIPQHITYYLVKLSVGGAVV